jgi:ribulose 1,5-bisphosphate synthetase/thiazole synthase
VVLTVTDVKDNSIDPAADIVIDATGYRFRCLPVLDEHGADIKLQGARTGHWVDRRCRLLDASGKAVPGLFAIGLGTGYLPSGIMGGEPSFTAQTNGLWYYQNDLGATIVNELLNEDPADLS